MNREQRRRRTLGHDGVTSQPMGPKVAPAESLSPMTPALAREEVGRLTSARAMMDWRTVELWLFVVSHFGPSAW